MDRLSVDDRVILWPDALWPQEIGVLGVLDGRGLLDPAGSIHIEAMVNVIEAGIPRVPRLRQVLLTPPRLLGPPLWVDDRTFDVREHVKVRSLPGLGDESDLLRSVEQIMSQRLDRRRPLWQIWLLPGLSAGRVGLFVRLHHVMADGIAVMAILGAFLDRVARTVDPAGVSWSPARPPSRRELLADNVARTARRVPAWVDTARHPLLAARSAWNSWRTTRQLLRAEPDPGTILDRSIGPSRRLALWHVDLATIAGIGQDHGATVNDVFLTLVAGGLRGWLANRGPVPSGLTMPIYVPKSLRKSDLDRARGNLIGQLVVPVPVGVADPGERLALIAEETRRQKARAVPPLGDLLGHRAGRRAVLKLIEHHPVSVTTADLIGPAEPRFLAGAELLDVFPVLPLISRVSVGVGALSYARMLFVTFVVDPAVVPDPDSLVAATEVDLATLTAATLSAAKSHRDPESPSMPPTGVRAAARDGAAQVEHSSETT